MGAHHNRCGAGRGSTPELAEKRGARKRECPLVQRTCGVELKYFASKNKNNLKILLTQNDYSQHTPRAPATAFRTNVPAFFPLSARRKTVNKEYRCLHNWKKR